MLDGLTDDDAETLRFSLARTYEDLRKRETELSEEIPRIRAICESLHADGHDSSYPANELVKLSVDRVHIQEGIDRLEELNYRFPFIQGAEFFHDES